MSKFLRFSLSAALLNAVLVPAHADSLDQFGLHRARGEAKFASGAGNIAFLAAGTLLPLLDGKEGRQQTFRTADAVLTSTILTEALKKITNERRPDGSSRSSFPSGHATAAFAVATMQSHFHPRQAPLWYAGAALIGASRVQLNRHYWHDVIAGAAVGFFTARLELRREHGLLLRPFIDGEAKSAPRTAGISFGASF